MSSVQEREPITQAVYNQILAEMLMVDLAKELASPVPEEEMREAITEGCQSLTGLPLIILFLFFGMIKFQLNLGQIAKGGESN